MRKITKVYWIEYAAVQHNEEGIGTPPVAKQLQPSESMVPGYPCTRPSAIDALVG